MTHKPTCLQIIQIISWQSNSLVCSLLLKWRKVMTVTFLTDISLAFIRTQWNILDICQSLTKNQSLIFIPARLIYLKSLLHFKAYWNSWSLWSPHEPHCWQGPNTRRSVFFPQKNYGILNSTLYWNFGRPWSALESHCWQAPTWGGVECLAWSLVNNRIFPLLTFICLTILFVFECIVQLRIVDIYLAYNPVSICMQ